MTSTSMSKPPLTIGIDLGDKHSHLCVLDTSTGELIERERLRTNKEAFTKYFGQSEVKRIAIEAGSQSSWISRLLESQGHEVIVANARQLKLIYQGKRKNDHLDAEPLARLARVDVKLLSPIKHRQEKTQADLAVVRARELLIRSRTQLSNHVRGVLKAFGIQVPKCSVEIYHKKIAAHIPSHLESALAPLLSCLKTVSEQIKELDKKINVLCENQYPETALLRQVKGVGPLIALTFILVLEKPERFSKSRSVGAYLGLTPGQKQSGNSDPQKSISKQGDTLLRHLLLQSAHYILGPFGDDSDLRRHGEAIAARAGKHAKKRALIAVARKLAVLLHSLWLSAEVYQPLRNSQIVVA